MKAQLKKIPFYFIGLFFSSVVNAQDSWPSPEIGQMYRHAQEYLGLNNYKEAITIYKQAILLAPGKFILYKELGKAYCLSGNYREAEKTLSSLIEKPEADEQCYQLLAQAQAILQNTQGAGSTLKKGIKRFPASGMLYYELGKVYDLQKEPGTALNTWLDGIQKAAAYPKNYYEAARAYMSTDNVVWGLLYGEIYLDIAQDTTGTTALKKMIFIAYKTMFDNMVSGDAADFGKTKKKEHVKSFAGAVQDVYRSLTPVVSDGITTENLTMVRTRFLMDWFAKYGGRYPFSLFTYQDYLLRNGLFDMYNEWLFGKAESSVEYEAWNQFHPGEMDLFLQKQKEHPLQPVAADCYNEPAK